MNRVLISSLLIITLLSALISPACAFNSGGMSFIEICGADGSIKTVALSGDQAPAGPSQKHKAEKECGFCFANANLKPMAASESAMPAITSSRYHRISTGLIAPRTLIIKPYEAQAPPVAV